MMRVRHKPACKPRPRVVVLWALLIASASTRRSAPFHLRMQSLVDRLAGGALRRGSRIPARGRRKISVTRPALNGCRFGRKPFGHGADLGGILVQACGRRRGKLGGGETGVAGMPRQIGGRSARRSRGRRRESRRAAGFCSAKSRIEELDRVNMAFSDSMSAVSFASITRMVGAKSTAIPGRQPVYFVSFDFSSVGKHEGLRRAGDAASFVFVAGLVYFRNVRPGVQAPIGPKRRAGTRGARF